MKTNTKLIWVGYTLFLIFALVVLFLPLSRAQVIAQIGGGGSGGGRVNPSQINAGGATTGDALVWSGTAWAPTALPGGGDALKSLSLAQFAATTSAQLAGIITNETGTGVLVFGTSPTFTTQITTPKIVFTGAVTETTGTGSPETVVTAAVGSVYHRTDGGTATTLYVKESGSSNTGWAAVGGGGGGGGTWGSITGTLSDQTDLQSALNAKAPAASPTFTGTVTIPTATTSDNSTKAASTAFVKAQVIPIASFQFDGSGAAVPAGLVTPPRPNAAGYTVTGYTITSDVSGSIVIDVLLATGAGSFTSITASATPTLSSQSYVNSSTLTGWTTSIASGTRFKGSITGTPATLTQATLTLYGTAN